jgi:hypothetical protein
MKNPEIYNRSPARATLAVNGYHVLGFYLTERWRLRSDWIGLMSCQRDDGNVL